MDVRARMRPWLAMAVLAVLSLGVTVFVAQRALSDASDIVVRGEGDVLLSTIATELMEESAPPTPDVLERIRAQHEAEGLRYVGLIERGGHGVAEAGTALMRDAPVRPGQPSVLGRRVRVAGPMLPPRPSMGVRPDRRGPGMALLVIELEPPVIAKLQSDLARLSIVAAVAGAVLLAFAVAWSRNAAQLAAIEQKAAREQRLVALGSMSSVMAHELRNPLASLKGHAQLLAEDLDAPKQKAKAERVVHEAERLEALTTSLLDFVRDGPIERSVVTPAALIARALEHLDASRVNVDVSRGPETFSADEPRLARALHNLVENALHAGSDKVDVDVGRDGDQIVIAVADRGPGIKPGTEAQIFEPFHTTRVRGTGLGLAVARRIAEQHGGTVTAGNREGGGARFEIRFADRA